ncbi:MAG: response regulator [Treponema sp.]|jgi:two-component system KDP operon response regulator KdpE|nr:response regulator [Treponema sp.]
MQTIMHVDNSLFFRKVMKTFLAEHGFLGESFSQGTEALEVIAQGHVALVITGMVLSDMNGWKFIKRIITSSNVPIIVLTSNTSKAEQYGLKALGIKDHILKSGAWKEKLLSHLYRL